MSMTETGYQPRLNLRLSARTVLVDLATVRAARGVDAESVLAAVDAGELRGVFDVSASADGGIRELRFWMRGVIAPETVAGLGTEAIIQLVLGDRATYRRGELEVQWVMSHVTVMRLIRSGEFKLHGREVTTESLRKFLRSRIQ